ncbi:MAG: ABC transporter substrate-binding protein [Acidimicrobiaceae bacterium]|nr:ABC transporter substrate-binding protein [Acidimicrobiaceae bacterium]MCY4176160.1 ABC transporter substrate-binding protein [Acidimicrobiaceae bacterium]MCY4294363.1 ABC transporter substrate-binding protein [Acidimicrobiaceae bacterium]
MATLLLGPELEQKGDPYMIFTANRSQTGRAANRRALGFTRRLFAVSAVLAVMSAAAGCGDDDSSDAVAQAATTTAAAEPSATAETAASTTTTSTTTAATTEATATTTTAAAAPATTVTVVTQDAGVERIVSISPTATEMAFAIGAGDLIVAVDRYSYYPSEAPVTDLDGWSPNVEAIASYEPDLVLMQGGVETAEQLEALGIDVWSHNAPATFSDVYQQIEQLGEAVGLTAEAAALNAEISSQIDDLVAAAPDASGLSYYHELDNTLYTVTSGTFVGEVYGLFGLENVADPADSDGSSFGYPQLSAEYLVDADPDLIFLADTLCCGQNAQTVAERPGWDQLTAVQNGRIVELNDDVASRWGPRLVEFIAAISEELASLDAAGSG